MSTRGLVLLDVDGTLTTVHSIWQHLLESQLRWEGKGLANLDSYLAGDIDYQRFCDLDAALLAGVPYATLEEVASQVPLRTGIDEAFAAFTTHGYDVALISTGLHVLNGQLATRFGVAHSVANDLTVAAGVCTGEAVLHIHEGQKAIHAKDVIDRFDPGHVIAIGDSASDVDMFALADFSVLVAPEDSPWSASADHHITDGDLAPLSGWLRSGCAPAAR